MTHPYEPSAAETAIVEAIWGFAATSGRYQQQMMAAFAGEYDAPYGLFGGEDQLQWASRVLDALVSGHTIDISEPFFAYGTTWDDVAAAIRTGYDGLSAKAEQRNIDRYDAAVAEVLKGVESRKATLRSGLETADDPLKFLQAHPEIIFESDGSLQGILFDKVNIIRINITADVPPRPDMTPWVSPEADWFLDNMTAFVVFAIYHHTRQRAIESVEADLIWWTDGGTGRDAVKSTFNEFNACIRRLKALAVATPAQAAAA